MYDGGYVLTIRHVVVIFLYDMHVLLFFGLLCSSSKWRTSKDIRSPEFGAGPKTLTNRLMGFVHYIKFRHCFYRRTKK